MAERRVVTRLGELLAAKARREGKPRIKPQEVQDATGLSRNTIDNYLHNTLTRFDAPVLLQLCDYFECTPGDLLVIEEVETPESEAAFPVALTA